VLLQDTSISSGRSSGLSSVLSHEGTEPADVGMPTREDFAMNKIDEDVFSIVVALDYTKLNLSEEGLADAMSVLSVKHPCTTALLIKKKIFHKKIVDAAEALYDVKLQGSMSMAVRAKFVVECIKGVNRKHGIAAATPAFAKLVSDPYETAPARLRHPEVSHHAPLLPPSVCQLCLAGACVSRLLARALHCLQCRSECVPPSSDGLRRQSRQAAQCPPDPLVSGRKRQDAFGLARRRRIVGRSTGDGISWALRA